MVPGRKLINIFSFSSVLIIAGAPALAEAVMPKESDPSCRGLYASMSPAVGEFRSGALYEEAVLAGEAPREYGAARRELTKRIAAQPEMGVRAANAMKAGGLSGVGGPGASLLALDVLGKAAPKEFVRAAEGLLKAPLPPELKASPEKLKAFQTQLGSRLLSHLAILPAVQGLALADLMARSPWLRRYVGKQDNAARTLINFKKSLGAELSADPAAPRKLAALRVLADEWIEPRRLETAAKYHTLSDYPETDWAFATVLAREMARFFQPIDPAVAKNYGAKARELARADVPAAFRENARVKALFEEFEIAD